MLDLIDQPAATALSSLGLAHPDDITDVTTLHGRALCYLVSLRDGQKLFVKQARAGLEADVVAEARIVQAVTSLGVPTTALLGVDEQTGTAAYASVAHWEPLTTAQVSLQPEQASRLGLLIADVHGHARSEDIDLHPTGGMSAASTEWLTLTPRTLSTYPAAYRQMWARLGTESQDAMIALAETWRADRLIHGDVKDDNIFLTETDAVLIDWETAGWGDPRWDLACLLGSFVLRWVNSMDLTTGEDLATWSASATTPLDEIALRCRSAVAGYQTRAELSADDIRTTVQYAGAFLAHRGLVTAMQSHQLPGQALLGVQLSRRFLLQPSAIQEMLL